MHTFDGQEKVTCVCIYSSRSVGIHTPLTEERLPAASGERAVYSRDAARYMDDGECQSSGNPRSATAMALSTCNPHAKRTQIEQVSHSRHASINQQTACVCVRACVCTCVIAERDAHAQLHLHAFRNCKICVHNELRVSKDTEGYPSTHA